MHHACTCICVWFCILLYNMQIYLHDCACVYLHAFYFALNCMCLHCSYRESCTYTLLQASSVVQPPMLLQMVIEEALVQLLDPQ